MLGQLANTTVFVLSRHLSLTLCEQPERQANDTVRVDLETGKIMDHVKFETGNLVMISPEDLVAVNWEYREMPMRDPCNTQMLNVWYIYLHLP